MRANQTEYLFSVNTHTPPTMTVDSGEEFTVELYREITRRLEVARITHLYGPTEATIDAVGLAVEGEPAGLHVPIGRPLSNYRPSDHHFGSTWNSSKSAPKSYCEGCARATPMRC